MLKNKTILIWLCLVLSLFLSSCNNNETLENSEGSNTTHTVNYISFSTPHDIPESVISEIIEAYLNGKDDTHRAFTYRIDCFWSGNGVYAIDIRNCSENNNGLESVTCTDGLILYKDGVFYSESEAYTNGIIGSEYFSECYSKVNSESNGNFEDDKVCIYLKPDEADKEYSSADFSFINCVSVEKIQLSNTPGILILTLSEHSKLRVIEAINKLEMKGFTASANAQYLTD